MNDGDTLAVDVAVFRQTYNTLRPHQALADRTPREAYLAMTMPMPQQRDDRSCR